jgi:dynein heavy chain
VDDWWGASQKMMTDLGPDKLKAKLVEFDKESIKEATIKVIDPICDDTETFGPEAIAKVSVACEAMCMWVHAMRTYYYVSKEVEPKRLQLASASEQLAVAAGQRDAAAARLDAVTTRLAKLEADLTAAIEKKAALEEETARCSVQLDNAEKLLSGLGGEAASWEAQSKDYQAQMESVSGDVMICAALISYLGPFVATYRADLIATWKVRARERERERERERARARLARACGGRRFARGAPSAQRSGSL